MVLIKHYPLTADVIRRLRAPEVVEEDNLVQVEGLQVEGSRFYTSAMTQAHYV
jgi:hypothetical protein